MTRWTAGVGTKKELKWQVHLVKITPRLSYHDTIKLAKRSSPLSRKKWPKRGSSLCQNNQNNPGGASGGGGTNWTKTKFCSIKGRASPGREVILTKWRPLSFLPASRARRQVCARAKRWRAPSAHNYTECWWRNLGRNSTYYRLSSSDRKCCLSRTVESIG